ncbi:hypothetical protein BYT27DRAFT_7255130 [Phlegmacium glaucopus]|nr:hypothetical protein BYT27DRAFT_7255130 [Phlegmacium glaucopus]
MLLTFFYGGLNISMYTPVSLVWLTIIYLFLPHLLMLNMFSAKTDSFFHMFEAGSLFSQHELLCVFDSGVNWDMSKIQMFCQLLATLPEVCGEEDELGCD